jgi:hypothetical protein
MKIEKKDIKQRSFQYTLNLPTDNKKKCEFKNGK